MNPFNQVSSGLQLFQGDPDYKVNSLVKNPLLQNKINDVGTDYDKVKGASSKALDKYIKDFLAGSKVAESRSLEEQNVIGGFYDGRVEQDLAGLRKSRADASRDAVARALGYAKANQNLARVGGEGGGSSYDTRLGMKTAADIEVANAMENAALERGDWDYLMRSKLGLAGARTGMADALAAREMIPVSAQKQDLGWNIGTIGDLLKLDQSNKFYGVAEDKDFYDKLIDFSDRQGQELEKDMSIMSSARGGGGGSLPSAGGYDTGVGASDYSQVIGPATGNPWALGPGY